MALGLDKRKTAIVPVIKKDNTYVIEVASPLWNEIQVLLLKGASQENTTLEFDIKTEYGS